ncbi:unnamed protein product [Brachionus calyciflorus]|uniref:Uncharacterized protein n=1 Tax=Brachionus calyciflorus TaxID=104777 RepID=A0A813ZL53_9BILA|nr:unnamed protein product [Brachionus calyciflorus]
MSNKLQHPVFKNHKCKICKVISKSSKKSLIQLEELNNQIKNLNTNNNSNKCFNRNYNIDYVSLTSLNKIQSSKCKSQRNEMYSDSIDQENLTHFKRASNFYSLKIILIILLHYSALLFYVITILRHSDEYLFYKNLTDWQIYLSYIGFLVLILMFPSVRSLRPFNYLIFIFYTLIQATFYWYFSYKYRTVCVLFFLIIITLGQIALIAFCFQLKFTLCSRPVIPYLYIYFVLVSIILIFLVIYVYLKLFFMNVFESLSLETEIGLNEAFVSLVVAFIFLFYEIFDLQLILANKFSDQTTCEQSIFANAFDLLTVDLIKILLVFNNQLLKIAK